MGENATGELFARRKPGNKLFAFYAENTIDDDRINGAQLVCRSYRRANLPKETTQAIGKLKKKPYVLFENAERLSKALANADPKRGTLGEMTRKGYIRNAEDLHALRSFAWTIGDYQKRTGTEYENVSEAELAAISKHVAEAGYLNYRGGSYFPGLCSRPDRNVYYLPEELDKETRKAIGELASVASLNRLRKDLIRIKPVMENVAMMLFAGTAEGLSRTCLIKVLSAWCACSIAAKEAFLMTDGPKVYRTKTVKKCLTEDTIDSALAGKEDAEDAVQPENCLITEMNGELVQIPSREVNIDASYNMLSRSAIPEAVLADARTVIPRMTSLGEMDIQFISKRITDLQEDGNVAGNDGKERSVEELIAEMMGTAPKKEEAAPAPAPTPVEPEWDVSTNADKIDSGWDVSSVASIKQNTTSQETVNPIPDSIFITPGPAPVTPEPAPIVPDPNYVAPDPMEYFQSYVAPAPAEEEKKESASEPLPFYLDYTPPTDVVIEPEVPVAPEPAPVIPEPVVVPEPAPVIPEPVAPAPAPVIPEPVVVPEPAPVAPEPVKPVSTIPSIAPVGTKPAEEAFQTNQASQTEMDEHELAVRKRMREILEQNKRKQQEKDEVRRQMEERRLEVAKKQEQRRQEILAKRKADYERLLAEQDELKKVVEENKNAIMGDRKRKKLESQRRIDEIEDIILKEYLDLKRGTNDYHTGLTQELY